MRFVVIPCRNPMERFYKSLGMHSEWMTSMTQKDWVYPTFDHGQYFMGQWLGTPITRWFILNAKICGVPGVPSWAEMAYPSKYGRVKLRWRTAAVSPEPSKAQAMTSPLTGLERAELGFFHHRSYIDFQLGLIVDFKKVGILIRHWFIWIVGIYSTSNKLEIAELH